jgi:Flp pilus assembly protein TadG
VKQFIAKFFRERSGLAAIEFAFIAPLMILLFLGIVEGSNALSVSRRVTLAVNTLADLASQESQLSADQLADLFTGVEQIIAQGDVDATIKISSLVVDPDTDTVVVSWSRDNAGGAPYAAGSSYDGLADASLLDESSSIIVAELDYHYSPPLTKAVFGAVDFAKKASRWPRRSSRVKFCTSPGVCAG